METINKVLTHLMTFCIHAVIMVLMLGTMGYHKGVLNNMNPLGATIDNFSLFGIAGTLMFGAGAFWLVRLVSNR